MSSQQQQQQTNHHWGYDDDDHHGPNQWPNLYQTGKFQSPINILVDFCALNGSNQHHHHHHHKHRTCCCATTTTDQRSVMSSTAAAAAAPNQSPPEALSASAVGQQLAAGLRRTHLDSIGEDEHHQRSSSTSSSCVSSESSSPVQNESASSCDDDYELHSSKRTTKCTTTRRSSLTKTSNSTPATKCVDCFPSAVLLLTSGGGHSKGAAVAQHQNTRHCVTNKKLFLGYPRYMSTIQLCNTGHSWQINIPPELGAHTLLAGPPLGDREYRLLQVHAHWGEDCSRGSEHQVNGKSFAAEIHFVHWNCTDFRSPEEAARHKHGLAVLGVLVMALEGEQNKNKHLDKIVQALKQVRSPNSSAELRTKLDLKKLFPANRWSYATYEGSLTTPPLSEVVDWLVFLSPITCSSSQIQQFQRINCEPQSTSTTVSRPMRKNCRPIQPTNNRLVSIWTHPMTNCLQ